MRATDKLSWHQAVTEWISDGFPMIFTLATLCDASDRDWCTRHSDTDQMIYR